MKISMVLLVSFGLILICSDTHVQGREVPSAHDDQQKIAATPSLGHANGDSAGANSNVGGYDDDVPGPSPRAYGGPSTESHHRTSPEEYNRIARNLPTPNNH
ncbi:hypothetical protein M6B38_391730 [Iris pallida]|uniref:Uncharacterized protein n=1 Tax=Iris pallida TaxID=29817 RepID=A0AAX6FZE2_IRIPA|nr:hypothetical protein M6B38_391730 [Iris pallida]